MIRGCKNLGRNELGGQLGDSWGDIVVTFVGAQLPPIFDFLGAQLGKLR